jgi:hypothetical protein
MFRPVSERCRRLEIRSGLVKGLDGRKPSRDLARPS